MKRVGLWALLRTGSAGRRVFVMTLCIGLAFWPGCKSQTPQGTRQRQPGLSGFLDALEANPAEAQPAQFEALAARHGLGMPVLPQLWDELAAQLRGRTWRPRCAMVLAARQWGQPFLSGLTGAYRGQTDVYTQCQLLSALIDRAADEPQTAQYALELLQLSRGGQWAAGVDLHGYQPFDGVAGELLPRV